MTMVTIFPLLALLHGFLTHVVTLQHQAINLTLLQKIGVTSSQVLPFQYFPNTK